MIPIAILISMMLAIMGQPGNVFRLNMRELGTVHATAGQIRTPPDGPFIISKTRFDELLKKFGGLKRLLFSELGEVKITRQDKPGIVYTGTSITLPSSPSRMPLATAIEWLQRAMKDEESIVSISEPIEAYPWDGARAFMRACIQMFGFVSGSNWPPEESITVSTDIDVYESVAWGAFTLPGIDGQVMTTATVNQAGQKIFQISARTKKKFEPVIHQLADMTRDILKTESIYRGKAVRFTNEQPPTFIDLSRVRPDELIYSSNVMEQVQTTIFAPILKRDYLTALHVPFKRGVALVGKYGVGKTLAIYVAALFAKERGITFILCENAEELPMAMHFARQYAPAVVAVEDVDRVTRERDELCNTIMDSLDGVESKDRDVLVLMTSNDPDSIHEAMRRPGRIDTFIHVDPPDALAVEKLLRLYGRGLIAADENLIEVCQSLAGQIPAVIRETVERAKLAAIARADSIDDARELTAIDLRVAARRLLVQQALFKPRPVVDTLADHLKALGSALIPDARLETDIPEIDLSDIESGVTRANDTLSRVSANTRYVQSTLNNVDTNVQTLIERGDDE